MRPVQTIYALALLAAAGLGAAQAAAIHKWVDADGVTHYSDEPPQTPPTTITRLDIDTRAESPASPTGRPDDYYSIANQWRRLYQESLQRQQLEVQRAALSARQQAAPEPAGDDREADSKRYRLAYPRLHQRRYLIRQHGHAPQVPLEAPRQTGINHISNNRRTAGIATVNQPH